MEAIVVHPVLQDLSRYAMNDCHALQIRWLCGAVVERRSVFDRRNFSALHLQLTGDHLYG